MSFTALHSCWTALIGVMHTRKRLLQSSKADSKPVRHAGVTPAWLVSCARSLRNLTAAPCLAYLLPMQDLWEETTVKHRAKGDSTNHTPRFRARHCLARTLPWSLLGDRWFGHKTTQAEHSSGINGTSGRQRHRQLGSSSWTGTSRPNAGDQLGGADDAERLTGTGHRARRKDLPDNFFETASYLRTVDLLEIIAVEARPDRLPERLNACEPIALPFSWDL